MQKTLRKNTYFDFKQTLRHYTLRTKKTLTPYHIATAALNAGFNRTELVRFYGRYMAEKVGL